MPAEDVDVGRKIAGKYELVRLIGRGAMGEVWLANHDSLGGAFAIKLVRPSEEPEHEVAGRFQLEAQVSARLSRKTRHIVSVSDHGEEDGLAYLVMELLEGESLDARIRREGPLDLATTVAIVLQISRALAQAHKEGIIHRDLKPANIFLSKDEDGRLLVKLLDFGIARSKKPIDTRSPFTTGKDMVLGTPSYMSPEQARGLDSLDHRCDLWALAVVAYESLTTSIPWEGETIEDIFLSICMQRMTPIGARRPDLGPKVDAFFTRSFAAKLDQRFTTADEVAAAFEALVEPAALEAGLAARKGAPNASDSPPTGSEPEGFTVGDATAARKRRGGSHGALVAAIAALLVAALLGGGFLAWRSRRSETTTARMPPPLLPSVTSPPPLRADPAPPPPPPTTTTEPAAPTTKQPATAASPSAVSAPKATSPRSASAAKSAPVAPPVAPAPTTAPPVATPVPAKKPVDKSEVF